MATPNNILLLLHKVLEGTASADEYDQLRQAVKNDPEGGIIDEITAILSDGQANHQQPHDFDLWEKLGREILQSDKRITAPPVLRVHFLRTAWFRIAAAVIILVTGIALYYNFSRTTRSEAGIAQTLPSSPSDIQPGYNRAVLTLSGGRQVTLDSAAAGIIKDGDLAIENTHGRLIYRNDNVVAMNTMTTPKGGQYRLTLADGTKVWLNAASSITYPTAFLGSSREVSVTGEAYFEVAKDKKPFTVKTVVDKIVVLGTSFNVNAYQDGKAVKTSLLEGAVKIEDIILKPGQAFIDGKVIQTDVEQDIAWKNGLFNFNRVTLADIARQLERWYNIEVEFEGKLPEMVFDGEMDRGVPLDAVLRFFGKSKIHYRIEGNKLIFSAMK